MSGNGRKTLNENDLATAAGLFNDGGGGGNINLKI